MNIGALIPIRLKSERLPNKALLDIAGKPACYHLLDRVCSCKFIPSKRAVVVCTTNDNSDDALVEAIEDYGCSVFRGDENDIIKRFRDAMESFQLDYVVQADGDDPLSATEYMDITMEELLANSDIDIVTVDGLPLGCATKSFSKTAVDKVFASYVTKENDTGFIYFFTKTDICNHHVVQCKDPRHQHSKARLTLDYNEDLDLFNKIFEGVKSDCGLPSLAEIVSYLKSREELCEINGFLEKTYNQRTLQKAKLKYQSASGVSKSIDV